MLGSRNFFPLFSCVLAIKWKLFRKFLSYWKTLNKYYMLLLIATKRNISNYKFLLSQIGKSGLPWHTFCFLISTTGTTNLRTRKPMHNIFWKKQMFWLMKQILKLNNSKKTIMEKGWQFVFWYTRLWSRAKNERYYS